MRYLLLMYSNGSAEDVAAEAAAPPPAASESAEPCWMPWHREMAEYGVVLMGGGQLQSSHAATTIRTRQGDVLISDGPFAETKEQILGYDLIECADLDEAIHAASRHPVALSGGSVEVRPLLPE